MNRSFSQSIQPDANLPGKEGVGTWAMAFFMAGALNLVLFGLMPGLQSGDIGPASISPTVRQIQVVRLRDTPKPSPQRETRPKPKPPKKLVATLRPAPATPSVMKKPQLAFEINHRLPAVAGSLSLPDMAQIAVGKPEPAPGAVFSMAELDHPLTALVRIPPVYPLFAKKRGTQGWVRVGFLVTSEGMVEDIRILDAEPKNIFDKSVIQCVSAWRFQPGTRNGTPVATKVETTIRFELQ